MKPCTEDEIRVDVEDVGLHPLSVLKRPKEAGHNMLAFDMGVWAPWRGRRESRFMPTAHVRNTEGEWVTKEEPGAQNI